MRSASSALLQEGDTRCRRKRGPSAPALSPANGRGGRMAAPDCGGARTVYGVRGASSELLAQDSTRFLRPACGTGTGCLNGRYAPRQTPRHSCPGSVPKSATGGHEHADRPRAASASAPPQIYVEHLVVVCMVDTPASLGARHMEAPQEKAVSGIARPGFAWGPSSISRRVCTARLFSEAQSTNQGRSRSAYPTSQGA